MSGGSNAGMHTSAGRLPLIQRWGPKGKNLAGYGQAQAWSDNAATTCCFPARLLGQLVGAPFLARCIRIGPSQVL
jgi:hypothetical protein